MKVKLKIIILFVFAFLLSPLFLPTSCSVTDNTNNSGIPMQSTLNYDFGGLQFSFPIGAVFADDDGVIFTPLIAVFMLTYGFILLVIMWVVVVACCMVFWKRKKPHK